MTRIRSSFGVGIDCEDVSRWRQLLANTGSRSLDALFTADEHAHCRGQADAAQSYAGCWCAKEAAVKAVTRFGRLTPRDVRIGHAPDGRPVVTLAHPWSTRVEVQVSVSHTEATAMAYALAVRRGAVAQLGAAAMEYLRTARSRAVSPSKGKG
jgi:holo-[acyl-carrier protein] synthase